MKNQTNHLEVNVSDTYLMKFGRITFFIFISGLVLISNLAISQTVPTVTSWTQSAAYSKPNTYNTIQFNNAGNVTFKVTLGGTDLNLVQLQFKMSNGTKIVDPELNPGNTEAVYTVTAATKYTYLVRSYPAVDGKCRDGIVPDENGQCRVMGVFLAGPGKHTLSATLVTSATNGETVTVTGGVSTSASWNFHIVNTLPPITRPQPPLPPLNPPPPPSTPPGQPPVQQNNAPVFTDGSTTTRSVAENTASEQNIGTPVAATDADDDTLTYTLGGTDAASFSIVSTTGQLRTSTALDFETKATYTVTVSVSDGNGGTDSITVTISVTDVTENRAPVFTDGDSTTRSVAENTASGQNIGTPVAATDADDDTLTYTLGGTDASSFSIVNTSGQLQTSAALDFETKATYTVTVSVSDGNDGTDSITVTISITDVTENRAPVFTDGDSTTRSVAENTASGTNIGSPIAATDADDDTLTYTLGGTDAASFSIVNTSGQLQTSAALDFETKATYTVTVSVSDGNGGTDSITVTISVTDVTENSAPVFTDGVSTTRSVAENTASGTNIGSPIAATDANNDTLTYTLGGTDASSFSIVNTSGQLQTRAALDFETKATYTVTVSVSDGNDGTDSITVTITVTDVNEVPANSAPVFTDGASATRSVAENTASGTNIGSPIAATDADNDTLTYTLGGTDAASFSIVNTSGQLQTSAALDYESKTSYSVTVTVSDSSISTGIVVTINITDVDETVELPPPPPSDAGTPPPSTPQPATLVNHTVKPFDYEGEGVGKVVFSEWMLSTLNNMPQWIELYNTTNEDINLRGWQLVGRFMDGNDKIHIFKSHTINSLTVKAKQSSLIVVYSASVYRGSFSESLEGNVYSLRSTRQLWNRKGVVLELQDSSGNPIDRVGNLNEQDQVEWRIPNRTRNWGNNRRRISLIRRLKSVKSRRYNFRFGVTAFGWFPADEVQKLTESKRSEYFYGMSSDVGTPGYRTEGADPLPVKLSSFIPQISESGQVVLSWMTASEIENAGFNVLRSESVAGSFTKINASLIQGAGTTSDRNEYTWIDTTAKPNVEYYYRIEDMSFDGISEVVATQRLKGIFTAGNRSLTRWAILKKATE